MKWKNLYYTLFLIILLIGGVEAQKQQDYQLLLKSGSFVPQRNVPSSTGRSNAAFRLSTEGQKSFVIIQFDDIPTEEERRSLKLEGIELLEYIPHYAYTATIAAQGNSSALARTRGRAIIELSAEQKMQPGLANGNIPAHAFSGPTTVDLWISYPKSFSYDEIRGALGKLNFQVVADDFKNYQILTVRLPAKELKTLASQPFIQYVQAIPQSDRMLNSRSNTNARSNVLRSSLAGGRNLSGAGVVIGIGDESNPMRHIDFSTRAINRAPIELGSHGIHVMGTTAGAGIMDERYVGHAPKATIIAQSYSSILAYSPQYVQDFGMVITNNSYGSDVITCETNGVYDLYSYIVDQQMLDMPHLQHVFAAGNSGTKVCAPFTTGFATVLGGYQTAKNVITVGAATETGGISPLSSRGPVKDGRVKPEIMALGSAVGSSVPVNLYNNGSGTSFSSPAVAGDLALLYERYRQLNGNQNPKNGLMKALLINGAIDKGNEGPDYQFGFGWLNSLRAVKMLESQSYTIGQVSHQATNNFSIDVPANTAQLKVMLYWNDPAGTTLASQNLVHNLDLKVINPASNPVYPRILNPAAAKVDSIAKTGVDNVNNMEQVVINGPTQGNYTISVKGTTVGQSPSQEYFVVYDIIPTSLAITYPIGNERLKDSDPILISWDAFGNPASTYTVQYSVNDGANWANISTSAAGASQIAWTIPAGTRSDKMRVRVTQNGTGAQSVSERFTVIGVPTLTLSSLQCEGYISVGWTAVTGATDYEVMMMKGNEMVSVATTPGTTYALSGLLKDSTYYVSVRARINGQAGRRALAISRKPDTGTCAGSISDNDLKVESIVTPASSGRKNTSVQLGNTVFVKIRIKNLDDVDFNGSLDIGYQLNGSSIPVETITPFIEKGKTYDHTFSVGADFANAGDYTLKTFIHRNQDVVTANDTLTKVFRQLSNDPIVLPFEDNMENLPLQTVIVNQTGLTANSRYDFNATTDAGRVRTFVNSGIAASGQKALTLDVNRPYTAGSTSYLTGTFNLASYNINTDDLRLIFSYKNHGQKTNETNKVWIRGKDTDTWIELYDLFANQKLTTEGYKTSPALELSTLLSANGKNFSSSFQVRWGQWGKMITSDYSNGAGYSFDDVRIISVTDDIQMLSLLAPPTESCGLSNAESIAIRIKNSSARDITNLPVALSLPNGTIIRDTIPSLAKRTTMDFTFNQKADLSAIGALNIKAWSALETDTFHDNDTLTIQVFNAPVFSSFPYLEKFENGDGYWYAKGTNSSWQFGTPASAGLSKAASGTKAWKTNLTGGYNDKEESYLYSPCFNVSGLSAPTLSFSAAIDLEVCEPTPCDYVYIEYSGNNGPWTRLGSVGQGTNWYNKTYSNNGAWAMQDYLRWHVASISLPTGFASLKLRFVLVSDGFTHREGIALDDIHIFDKIAPIQDSGNGVATQQVSGGSTWVNFIQNGKLLAAINPNGQNLGNTQVQTYINTVGARNANGQYYLDRSFTIKPANSDLADFATVRFYFLETESNALIDAVGCGTCDKPANPFELGISKYRNVINTSREDGSMANSTEGSWSFHPASEVAIVPYDKGYYVEMKMKNFSEFWLSKGFAGNPGALPVDLISFNARKKTGIDGAKDVALDWETASEENFDHFDIEVAAGDQAYRQGRFVRLTQVFGAGALKDGRKYEYVDQTPGKWGNLYYRLKMVDVDSTYRYSRVQTVAFENQVAWSVYPNPSNGVFYLGNKEPANEMMSVNVYDLHGRVVKRIGSEAFKSEQKPSVDISGKEFHEGIYVLEVVNGETKQVFQVLKN